jgi:serine/threonine-protein phosphatase with EF-hand domain
LQRNSEKLLKLIEGVYRWLPLGTIVNNKVLIVHGGISDTTDLDLIRSLDRGKVSGQRIIFRVEGGDKAWCDD